ncbi:MAG: LysR family transcriptional regulator [Proteobacteria bacterium]|nr:LysR family transcriptional regulator [Pseudomonadota bacterium]
MSEREAPLDWDFVRTFLAAARRGQFLAASRALRVNQATVARHISALEGALGATLFERATTGITLTEAGHHLLAHAERMESEMLQAQADLRQRDVELSGTVRIGAPDGFSMYFLIPALEPFLRRHPGIDIQLVPMPLATSLIRREVDLAITLEAPEAGRLVSRKLTEHVLGIFGARTYLDRAGTPRTVEDLAAHRLIGYVDSYAFSDALSYVSDLFGSHATSLEAASAAGQTEAVRAGLGLGVLHHFIAQGIPDLVQVLPERQARRGYWLVVHEDLKSLGRIRAVIDHIVEEVAVRRSSFMGA